MQPAGHFRAYTCNGSCCFVVLMFCRLCATVTCNFVFKIHLNILRVHYVFLPICSFSTHLLEYQLSDLLSVRHEDITKSLSSKSSVVNQILSLSVSILCGRISQSQHFDILGQIILCCGGLSQGAYRMISSILHFCSLVPGTLPHYPQLLTIKICLQTLLDVPWGQFQNEPDLMYVTDKELW